MECHTPLERSYKALLGFVKFGHQTKLFGGQGPLKVKKWGKIRFGGFEAVRGHIPMRSKVILKAPWVMVLTQPPKKILLDILL